MINTYITFLEKECTLHSSFV